MIISKADLIYLKWGTSAFLLSLALGGGIMGIAAREGKLLSLATGAFVPEGAPRRLTVRNP